MQKWPSIREILNMLRKISSVPRVMATAAVALLATSAWAAQDDATVGNTSSTHETTTQPGALKDEVASIRPEVAILAFQDAQGDSTTRGAIGLHYDLNMSNLVSSVSERLYFGPSFGGLYSHIGSSGSNFIASNSSNLDGNGGANLVEIPLEMKLGYNVTDNVRISAHGGGTLLYRSIADSMQIDGSNSSASNWKIYPAVGGDLEMALGGRITLDFRPDVTLTPINTLFTGALGFGVALG
jgi:hypothetical protein